MIRLQSFHFRPVPGVLATLTIGAFAMATALVPLGCASKKQAVVVSSVSGEAPHTEVSAAAPGTKDSPDAKLPDAPIPTAPTVPPSEKEDDSGTAPQQTAPIGPPVQDRREATPPAVKTPKAPVVPAPSAVPRGKNTVAPSPGKQAATPPLDLKSLEQRLRDTKAIGVFTKLSLKNQVDDLLSQFRTFHEGKSRATLTALRESYNLLIMKVLSLLQDSDAPLARDLAASREAIWGLLADPVKFAAIS
jgi:hypothetical protein